MADYKVEVVTNSDLPESLKEFCVRMDAVVDRMIKEHAELCKAKYRAGGTPVHEPFVFPRVRSSLAAFVPRGDRHTGITRGYGYGGSPSSASTTNDKAAPAKEYHCRHCAKTIEKSKDDKWAHTDGTKTFHEPIPFPAELGGES